MPTRHKLTPAEKKNQTRINKDREKARVDAYMAKASSGVKGETTPPKAPKTPGGIMSGLDRLKNVMGGRKKY